MHQDIIATMQRKIGKENSRAKDIPKVTHKTKNENKNSETNFVLLTSVDLNLMFEFKFV